MLHTLEGRLECSLAYDKLSKGVSPVQVLPAAQMWVIQLRPEEEGPTCALLAQNGFANVIGIVEIQGERILGRKTKL
jgi:hypothetical protein